MSFSADVKKELSKMGNFCKENLLAELVGYFMSGNMLESRENFDFITENEFNIERFYKMLFQLDIAYEPERKGKCFVAQIQKKDVWEILQEGKKAKGDVRKNIVKGAFLGAGSVNNPQKNYHLEMIFSEEENGKFVSQICEEYGVNFKQIMINEKYQLYLKEGEEISRFLALIGANCAVLKFEEVRVMKQMKNQVNRKVNCETANLNKTIEASIRQIEDIELIKTKGKFEQLPKELKEVAVLRLKNPELSLQALSQLMEPPIRKIRNESTFEENS